MALNIQRAQADETTEQNFPLQSAITPFRRIDLSANAPVSTPMIGQSQFLTNYEKVSRIRYGNTLVRNLEYKVGSSLEPIYDQTITPNFILDRMKFINAIEVGVYKFFQCKLIVRIEVVASAAHQGLLGIAMWDGLLGASLVPPGAMMTTINPDTSTLRRFYQQKPMFMRTDKTSVIEFEVPCLYPLSSYSTAYNTRLAYLRDYPMKHIQIRPLIPLQTKSETLQIPIKVVYRMEDLTWSTPTYVQMA
jgi:hypothetical protein